jgi:hypothetical protein
MNIASFLFCIYYNMIIAYSLYYLVLSFKSKLDWTKCHYTWASLSIFNIYKIKSLNNLNNEQKRLY